MNYGILQKYVCLLSVSFMHDLTHVLLDCFLSLGKLIEAKASRFDSNRRQILCSSCLQPFKRYNAPRPRSTRMPRTR